MMRDWIQNKASLLAIFVSSIALGALASFHSHIRSAPEGIHYSESRTARVSMVDPAAQSVRAVPKYGKACAARGSGKGAHAAAVSQR